MAPTETAILRSFLLQKSSLRDILTFAEFSSFFPASKRSSPLIRELYRDLQTQRNAICQAVLQQINVECHVGENYIATKRAERDSNEVGEEDHLDVCLTLLNISLIEQLFGTNDVDAVVGLDIILPQMDNAIFALRRNVDRIQEKIDDALARLQRSLYPSCVVATAYKLE
jgi:centromere-localized protein 2